MLNRTPMPMYMMGFPPGVQDEVYQTVQKELETARKIGMPLRDTEMMIAINLNRLKTLCLDKDIHSLGPANCLTHYIAAIECGKNLS